MTYNEAYNLLRRIIRQLKITADEHATIQEALDVVARGPDNNSGQDGNPDTEG